MTPGSNSTGTVTSGRLASDADVRSRLFPKTRSWFALGAPLELLSPLSVLRIVYGLAVVLWPVEALVLRWPASTFGWVWAATFAAACVWVGLLFVKDLSPRFCHILAALASVLVMTLVYSGRSTGPVLAATFFLIPVTVFVSLYFSLRAVVEHVALMTASLWLALVESLHAGAAAAVSVPVFIALLSASCTIRVLMVSILRAGSVDPDTGLPNGVGLLQRISSTESRSGRREDRVLVIATVQIAGLDDARQALGYRVGTELLRRAVEDLGQVLPADAVINRVEADELVVAYEIARADASSDWKTETGEVPGEVTESGVEFARVFVNAIAAGRYLVNGVGVMLRAHVGLAFAPWDGSDAAELVRRSSISARRAFHSGRPIAVWDGDRDALTPDDLALLADLRAAGERGELWLAYQPQVDVKSGRIVSVEALLRWDSPVHGSVPPGRFIILAERTGLVDQLTEWVMTRALDAQVRWRRKGVVLPVSVNLSAKTLAWPDLSDWILNELARRELPHAALSVEVTETAAADLLDAVQLLSPLHEQGIRVSIDDFGTGYTSLAAIPYLPLDEIKVDMGFVKRSVTSPADEAIVRSVRELAHRLGLTTVAEGVEDEAIARLMVEIGFDLLQGYHFAKPLSEEALLDLVSASAENSNAPGIKLTGLAS
jgi:EAL domain-containing protein (putative c-di-GMP-specific phosphodiesterase class I)/GGDEF domain-containing protein